MQQTIVKKENQNQKEEKEQNALELVKRKPSLFKKKKLPPTRLYPNIDLNLVININDICFVNERSIKDPQNSQETLLKTLFHYKMISKVTLNSSFVNVELKKNSENTLSPEYFFERLRSMGDRNMANIAMHLENIHKQFSMINEDCPVKKVTFQKEREEFLLNDFMKKMEGRMYFLYFSQVTPKRITMRNIFFSIPLLKALGCNLKNIAMDFLKYKHVFFEVFTAKNYKSFMEKCLQNYGKIIQAQSNPNIKMTEEEKEALSYIYYDDEVIRKKQGPQGIYQELINAKVRWFAPHPSVAFFEILSMDGSDGIRLPNKRRITNFEQTKPEEELRELRNIGIDYPLLQIEDEPIKTQKIADLRNEKQVPQQNHVKQNHVDDLNRQFNDQPKINELNFTQRKISNNQSLVKACGENDQDEKLETSLTEQYKSGST